MTPISFIINTSNNTLEYVKILIQSLKENLKYNHHEILIFIDSDNENTLEYLLSIKDEFNNLKIIKNLLNVPIGYQRNKTLLVEYASNDLISYLQSDMVIGKDYDVEVFKHAKPGTIISSTRVEPPLHNPSPVTFTYNLGVTPDEFSLDEWNKLSVSLKQEKQIDYFFAPITFYKQDLLKLGGYDTIFRRSREDSDFVQRALHAGIKLIQVYNANVYHFTCVSSRGQDWYNEQNESAQQRVQLQSKADNIEVRKFIKKWGSFSHTEQKLYKLDIDLVVENYKEEYNELIYFIEPYFQKVWLDNADSIDFFVKRSEEEQVFANNLLGYSQQDWETNKYLFNTSDTTSVYNTGYPEDDKFNILCKIDFNKITNFDSILQIVLNIQNILYPAVDKGKYKIGEIEIMLNKKIYFNHIEVKNPPFNYSLLQVY